MPRPISKSGETGVIKVPSGFAARHYYKGKRHTIGRFLTCEAAVLARQAFIKMFNDDKELALKSLSKERLWNNSTTKARGVVYNNDGAYTARVMIEGVRHYVGYFKSIEEAADARLSFIASRA